MLISEKSYVYDIAYPKNVLTEKVYADPTGSTYYITTYTYDSLGRPLTVSRSDASGTSLIASTAYDDNTNTITSLSYQGPSTYAKTVTVNDWLGRTTSIAQYDGTNGEGTVHVTAFSYDNFGNVLTKVLPNGETYSYTYTYSGLPESIIYPDGRGTETRTYDGNGNLRTRTDVGGNLTTYTYNAADLESSRTASATGKSTIVDTTTYSQWGPSAITQTVDGVQDMAIVYGYNYLGLVTRETRTISTGGVSESATIGHTYDNAGNLDTLSISGFGGTYAKTLDYSTPYFGGTTQGSSSARTTSVSNMSGTVLGRASTLFSGALDEIDYVVPGYYTQYTNYDAFMRPRSIDNPGSSYDQTNTYDLKGNVLTWNGTTYTYDGLDQLATDGSITYAHDLIGNTTTAGSNGYTYDPLGSTSVNTMRLTGASGSVTTTFTDDGNLGNLLAASGRYSNLTYDAFNRLMSITDLARSTSGCTDSYAYDPMGLRYRKSETLADGTTETTYYLYEGNNILYEEARTSGALAKANFNIYLGGMNIGRYQYSGGTESLQYFYEDHLGSRRAVTDTYGQVEAYIAYSTWGVPTVTNVGAYDGSDDISYTGKELDATGLYYFNARYYDPQTGRFITEDPARDGLNWYVYCGNNPLSFTDSTGLQKGKDDPKEEVTASDCTDPDWSLYSIEDSSPWLSGLSIDADILPLDTTLLNDEENGIYRIGASASLATEGLTLQTDIADMSLKVSGPSVYAGAGFSRDDMLGINKGGIALEGGISGASASINIDNIAGTSFGLSAGVGWGISGGIVIMPGEFSADIMLLGFSFGIRW